MGGLTLQQLLATRAMAGEGDNILTGKSVVMLNLQGGPTHIETFDPKMSAPNEYRAMFGETKTSLPGVTFGSHFPMLGKLAHKMAVVRSFDVLSFFLFMSFVAFVVGVVVVVF